LISTVVTLTLLLALSGLTLNGYRLEQRLCSWIALAVVANVLSGIVLTPVFLPCLPGRSFSVKGAVTGAALGASLAWLWPEGWLARASVGLLSVAACSYFGLMFTGSSPYTSASGVRREMSWALPAQGALALVGLAGWVAARFV
jgi:hypothetical protein